MYKRQLCIEINSKQFSKLKTSDTEVSIGNNFKRDVWPFEDYFFCLIEVKWKLVERCPVLYMLNFLFDWDVTSFWHQQSGVICKFYNGISGITRYCFINIDQEKVLPNGWALQDTSVNKCNGGTKSMNFGYLASIWIWRKSVQRFLPSIVEYESQELNACGRFRAFGA